MKRLFVASFVAATSITLSGCIDMALNSISGAGSSVTNSVFTPAVQQQANRNVLNNLKVQSTPPIVAELAPNVGSDPYAQFLYNSLTNWTNSFRALGGTQYTPKEQADRLAAEEKGYDNFIAQYIKFQSRREAEQSWQKHIAQRREALTMSRKLPFAPPGAKTAYRSEPTRKVMSVNGMTTVRFLSTAGASYEFSGNAFQAYDRQLQDALQGVRQLMAGRDNWHVFEQAQGNGGHMLHYNYRWREPDMLGADYHQLSVLLTASAPSEWSPDFSISMIVSKQIIDSAIGNGKHWQRMAQR